MFDLFARSLLRHTVNHWYLTTTNIIRRELKEIKTTTSVIPLRIPVAIQRIRSNKNNQNGRVRSRISLHCNQHQTNCHQTYGQRATGAELTDGEETNERVHDGTAIIPADITSKFADDDIQMYSKLVQRCFDDCVNDFTTKSLISREEGCVMRCVDKWLKGSERLGQRFQEQNAAMMQGGGLPGR